MPRTILIWPVDDSNKKTLGRLSYLPSLWPRYIITKSINLDSIFKTCKICVAFHATVSGIERRGCLQTLHVSLPWPNPRQVGNKYIYSRGGAHFIFRSPELGASLFKIAQSLFALERTGILGVMALNKKKSKERRANWQNQILSGSLMSDIMKKERSNSKSDFKDRTVIMVEKRIKMHNLYIF